MPLGSKQLRDITFASLFLFTTKGVCPNPDVLRQAATLGLRLSGLVLKKPNARQLLRTMHALTIAFEGL